MKTARFGTRAVILGLALAVHLPAALTAQDEAPKQVLFTNVKVFNGTENKLHDVDVLVRSGKAQRPPLRERPRSMAKVAPSCRG